MSPDHAHPNISSSLNLFVLCHVCHTLLFVYFFKLLIPYIGCLDKCRTSAFSVLFNTCFDRVNPLQNKLWFFSSTGRRPASLCHGPLSVVRASVRPLTFSLNIFFAETTYRILMKFHRNVPTMVLFRIS